MRLNGHRMYPSLLPAAALLCAITMPLWAQTTSVSGEVETRPIPRCSRRGRETDGHGDQTGADRYNQ